MNSQKRRFSMSIINNEKLNKATTEELNLEIEKSKKISEKHQKILTFHSKKIAETNNDIIFETFYIRSLEKAKEKKQ